eukprot:scaffold357783_cov18-Prasinocladus_malaysianus.AAC.1
MSSLGKLACVGIVQSPCCDYCNALLCVATQLDRQSRLNKHLTCHIDEPSLNCRVSLARKLFLSATADCAIKAGVMVLKVFLDDIF